MRKFNSFSARLISEKSLKLFLLKFQMKKIMTKKFSRSSCLISMFHQSILQSTDTIFRDGLFMLQLLIIKGLSSISVSLGRKRFKQSILQTKTLVWNDLWTTTLTIEIAWKISNRRIAWRTISNY